MFGGKLAGRSRRAGTGSVIAETEKLCVDQARVDLVQRREPQPGTQHDGRTIVLDQHVFGRDQPEKSIFGSVEGDAP
jgi:hypothetical protein